jgi:nucleoside-diphosphate-sugar epimerase
MQTLFSKPAMSADLHVVLGATGGVGRTLVETLAGQGRHVRAVSRTLSTPSPDTRSVHGLSANVEYVAADITQPMDVRRACDGATVVYHAAQPPYHQWPELFPAMTAHVIEGAASANAKLVMVDNLYMYGPTAGPLHEQTPRNASGRKGRARAAMETQLLDAHRSGKLRVTIGRLSDYYGPHGGNSALSALILEPASKGKAMRWMGTPDVPRTLHFIADAARGLITLADHADADGKVWHLPSADPITGTAFMKLINERLATPVATKTLGILAMKIGGLFSKEAKESIELMHQWTDPFVVDSSAFTRAFGSIPTTPHAAAVAATIDWMKTS